MTDNFGGANHHPTGTGKREVNPDRVNQDQWKNVPAGKTISAHRAAHSDLCRGTFGAFGEQSARNSTKQQLFVQFDSGDAADGYATNGHAIA